MGHHIIQTSEEVSMLTLASAVLRRRRMVIGLTLVGAVIAGALALANRREYVSGAIFIPQASDDTPTELALAASQFGLKIPTNSGGWGPPVYVELLRSRALLEPIALDTLVVMEEDGRRAAVMDLLNIRSADPKLRLALAVRGLRSSVGVAEEKGFGAVRLTVRTPWPSVSYAIADRLVGAVAEFNISKRKSQATAERVFVEAQAAAAAAALTEAEERLETFLQRNRAYSGSPELLFQNERLQRDVALRQELYTSWVKSREDARIREVRDIPVVTILEDPQVPVMPEPRGTVTKAAIGALGGALLGIAISLVFALLARARQTPSPDAQEFFQLVDEASPRFMRRLRQP